MVAWRPPAAPIASLENPPSGGALPDGAPPRGALPGGALPGGALPGGALPGGRRLARGPGAPRPPGRSPVGDCDSGVSGSMADLDPADGASLKRPPAALSQIMIEMMSPGAIGMSGGSADPLNRA